MKKSLKIIAAFAIGATAGSALGMLLAPDKQKEPAGEKAGETKTGKKKNKCCSGGVATGENVYAEAEANAML